MRIWIIALCFAATAFSARAQVFPGADEATPARAQYFSWINNTNEGATEAHTLTNLEFFQWLDDAYGMRIDIYAFDAGAIDGKRWYGSNRSEKFIGQFPNGFDRVYERARNMDIRLGIWGGPDGFGDTKEEAETRSEMIVELCDKYDFALFKFDTVAGDLRDEKQQAFAEMMSRCREHTPDLILLNHRINLGEISLLHATTFLWEGQETYTDVHIFNTSPAPHHRAGALQRGLPPGLTRLTEDHGVCLSSALDHWEDELVLQAFNRALILSPQIYCNPWLLADDEFPRLARIFNLAREYRDILVSGIELPERRYGPSAVSRGNGDTRLITLRNLSWEPKAYRIRLDEEVGLSPGAGPIELRRQHPREEIIGRFEFGEQISVTVEPFRSALFRATRNAGFGIEGVEYEVVRNTYPTPIEIDLIGEPGETHVVSLVNPPNITSASIDGDEVEPTTPSFEVFFEGTRLREPTHRLLGRMQHTAIPDDAESLYEATVFSADSNALEVRSLQRSGPSQYPAVRNARDAFFDQELFTDRAIWDRNLFDGNRETKFSIMRRWTYWWNRDPDTRVEDGGFRLDFGRLTAVDEVRLFTENEVDLQPAKTGEGVIAEVSADLGEWTEVRFVAGREMRLHIPPGIGPIRYLRILEDAPQTLSEVEGYKEDVAIDRDGWRASNLFASFEQLGFEHAWSLEIALAEVAEDSFLAVAAPGNAGNEGVYAALRVDGKWIGAPDRAPSYPANTWELQVAPVEGDYTYYIPVDERWVGSKIEVFLFGKDRARRIRPEVWLSRRVQTPLAKKRLVLIRESGESGSID